MNTWADCDPAQVAHFHLTPEIIVHFSGKESGIGCYIWGDAGLKPSLNQLRCPSSRRLQSVDQRGEIGRVSTHAMGDIQRLCCSV